MFVAAAPRTYWTQKEGSSGLLYPAGVADQLAVLVDGNKERQKTKHYDSKAVTVWLAFQHSLIQHSVCLVGTYLTLPWYHLSTCATCVFVAVNTSHTGVVVLASTLHLTLSPFPRARCGRLLPKQFFLVCLLQAHKRVSKLFCKLHQEVHPPLLLPGAWLIKHMCIQ